MRVQLTKNVADFLQSPVHHFIGGQFKTSATSATGQVLNPSDGSVLATVAMGGAAEVDEAVAAAWKAFPAWSALSPNERAAKLHRFAEQLEKHTADLALIESLDVGKAITAAEGFDVPFGIEALRYFANLSTHAHYDTPLAIKNIEARTHRAPYGVCGFVFPWNFPFTLLLWGIAPALAAGNTVVVKPSEVTPLSSIFAAKLAAEAGIPDGVAVAALKETKTGPGPARETQMGPLVSETQRRRIIRYLENGVKAGAQAILPGGASTPRGYEGGFYVQPSLLASSPDNVCCRKEIFGPSAFLLKFKDEAGAVSLVNQLAYGLANSVWSSDLKRAGRSPSK